MAPAATGGQDPFLHLRHGPGRHPLRPRGPISQRSLATLLTPADPLLDRRPGNPELLSDPRRWPPRQPARHDQLPGVQIRSSVSVSHRGPPASRCLDTSTPPGGPPTFKQARRQQPLGSLQLVEQPRERGRYLAERASLAQATSADASQIAGKIEIVLTRRVEQDVEPRELPCSDTRVGPCVVHTV